MRKLQTGITSAAFAVGGKAAARMVPQFIGIPTTGALGMAAQVLVGLGIGLVADRLPISSQNADAILTGALMGPIESAVVAAGVPLLSPALSSYPLASYPAPAARLNAIPNDRPQSFGGYGYAGSYGAGYEY